ncbi:MAG: hypothetical protein FWE37_03610 [Spirochaetaceae bacterium]|nr:hypothetical protein [Spirochaetaceae bacterium]
MTTEAMTLDNFENYFSAIVLQRALGYFEAGKVSSFEEEAKGQWLAEVDGNEIYTVKVIFDNDKIVTLTCDCPDDLNRHCKHVGALLFALREEKANASRKPKAAKKIKLETELPKLSKEELIEILLNFAGRDRQFKSELVLRFADNTDIIEESRKLIKKSINAASHRYGLESSDVGKALKGAKKVLALTDEQITKGNTLPAVQLCFVVLEETIELWEDVGYHNNHFEYTIKDALEKLTKAVEAIPSNHQESFKVFKLIFDHALSKLYDEAEYSALRMQILAATVPLCANAAIKEKLMTFLITKTTLKEYDNRHYWRAAQEIMVEVMTRFGSREEATLFIEANLDNEKLRRIAASKALESKNYSRVIELSLAAEADEELQPEVKILYKGLRYRAYEGLDDKAAQIILAKELLLAGYFEYFTKYKTLIKVKEWPLLRKELLSAIKKLKDDSDYTWFKYSGTEPLYTKVLIAEEMWRELLAYCDKNKGFIPHYAHLLLPYYSDETESIFTIYILESAQKASDRKRYKAVVELVKSYQKTFNKNAVELLEKLRKDHARQPAFIDELSKTKAGKAAKK